jgi:DNA-binding NarL/FixJ family response regulator
MPGLNGLEVALRAAKVSPRTKILILSMHSSETYVARALRAGAVGYLLKEAAEDELSTAIKVVSRGEVYLSPKISMHVVERYVKSVGAQPDALASLTTRQREILQLVAEGRSSKEIAVLLDLSTKTVESHRGQVMARLGVHDVTGLVRFAIRAGLVSPDS